MTNRRQDDERKRGKGHCRDWTRLPSPCLAAAPLSPRTGKAR
jgi:hypothetical protein